MTNYDYGWETFDFRPAPIGYRAVFLDRSKPGEFYIRVMVGWMIQRETKRSPRTGEYVEFDEDEMQSTRVIAAYHDDAEVKPVDYLGSFWYVLEPGKSEPTREQAEVELKHRLESERREREWRQAQGYSIDETAS